ncbi:hypothetical protein TrVE_jg905 [Triparma verrucosa]|uniref:Uncharacterized protein n=1 Tax=Triparma verrucosa TaxID=1606542 RepID=A0A9W7FL03_9STRA|nr:hypothetical protein TrVE_jg905 [Triparma verrucosa]
MTIFVLEIKAEFENIASVSARPDNEWSIDLKNPLNDYEERKAVTIRASELQEMENEHQAPVNFAVKWEGANKMSTLIIMNAGDKALKGKKKQPSNAPRPVVESETWTPVLAVDCRGVEPSGWNKGEDEFTVESTGGSKFEEGVDFSDDWCEYCEKSEDSVGINNVEWRWTTV